MTLYLFYLLIINMYKTEKSLQSLFSIMEVLAVVIAFGNLLKAFAGNFVPMAIQNVFNLGVDAHISSDVSRVVSEGQALVGVMFLFSIGKLCFYKRAFSLWNIFAIVLFISSLMISFYRSLWVANIICLLIMFALIKGRQKGRLLKRGIQISLIIMLIVAVAGSFSSTIRTYQKGLADRVQSTTPSANVMNNKSLTIRFQENEYAFKALKDHAWLGIGMGNEYRPVKFYGNDYRAWIHNGYLALALNFGLVGLVFYFSIYILALIQTLIYFKDPRTTDFMRIVLLVGFVTLIQYLLTGFFGPAFIRMHMIPLIALSWACAMIAKMHLDFPFLQSEERKPEDIDNG